jgi:ribosomal-protein-alanine N-acetyltransferase
VIDVRRARLVDLEVLASWLLSPADCARWAGHRVSFPVDPTALPGQIEWKASEGWSLVAWDGLAAFGQLVPKADRRIHLARLIVAPERRGSGLGRQLALHLLDAARAHTPRALSLNVDGANAPAVGLYRALGFREAPRPADEPLTASLYMEHRE